MIRTAAVILLTSAALAAPALAADFPVSGQWGQSAGTEPGPIDCAGKRVMNFKGNQRTDSKGGVPAYRNKSVTEDGPSSFRVVDEFTTGQQAFAYNNYRLNVIDTDHIEIRTQQGETIKLQRCK